MKREEKLFIVFLTEWHFDKINTLSKVWECKVEHHKIYEIYTSVKINRYLADCLSLTISLMSI